MDPLALMTKGWSTTPGSAPEPYIYQALEEEHQEFRLLKLVPSRDPKDPLRATIATVRPDWLALASDQNHPGPRWTALSYVWADPDEPTVVLNGQQLRDTEKREEILIENAAIKITSNLFGALMLIRGYEDFCTVWADQICINQADLKERTSQVQQMHMIFSLAENVLVWLGKAIRAEKTQMFTQMFTWLHSPRRTGRIEDAPSFAQFMARLMTGEPHLYPPPSEDHHLFTKQIAKDILEDPWFSRSWVIQEAVHAKNLLVYLGPVVLPWEMFEEAISGLSYWTLPWSTAEDSALATFHRGGLQMIKKTREWQESRYKHETLLPSAPLSTLLQGLRVSRSTDAREKVYAFWHMADQEFRAEKGQIRPLPISYERSTQEVYGRTVTYCINSEMNLDVLSCACKHEVSRENSAFPSWMHDWQVHPDQLGCATDLHNILPQRGCDAYAVNSENRSGKVPFNACAGRPAHYGRPPEEPGLIYSGQFDKIGLRGILFDEIRDVTSVGHSSMPAQEMSANQEIDWGSWWDCATTEVQDDPYLEPEARIEAFCQALTFGNVKISGHSHQEVIQDFKRWWSAGRPLHDPSSAHSFNWSERLRSYEAFKKLPFPNGLYINRRRLFRTARGYIGSACEHIEPGDMVWILWGGALPFLLRNVERQEGVYYIVGGAVYVPGIMFGEAIAKAEEEGKEAEGIWLA
ncbi:uncharacterized protein Z520_06187 [Fonsecaea multimorphosa CBS 102226]|uniref:Heterokaryon incompatibility domain-containing protein n=1 Tax=Fonsecaea multimorphosa CBS 102226 TaxID=1442371 RepID=A0A0D2JX04_9EURO|nr:uncharacterized protein Z520_06187 [Fonsecaea multimorphosa CBS 102226]KIX98107.1 hypothetical protein Z520_06187 [Fonsecaea multimorphosa CBS 102226]OAL24184.1 hypothetical protein AYO22_05844 [Fonsecaea multimorphosa]